MSSSSEWMKVMLDEIARKKREAEQDRAEGERRRVEQGRVEQDPATVEPGDPAMGCDTVPARC